MIPLTLATEVRTTLVDYLRTTFNLQDDDLAAALFAFLEQELFQGPYVDLRLPFRKAEPDTPLPLEIAPAFTPYVHQVQAFQRLTSANGHAPQPTLITTGTGSGKTEAFLYPILDHCYRHRGERGIKAILLYPMNALATDQARRLAAILWQDPRLQHQVTAGIYIGGEAATAHKVIGPDWLVDDRETLRQHPPDILLTNYKMLDFLLLRPEDKPLWAHNGPETLRYLVLDELHTYDGAQGADVAGLLRRLKARLQTPPGWIGAAGTSATMGASAGDTVGIGDAPLLKFAGEVFGETFDRDSIVRESRLPRHEFLRAAPVYFDLPADRSALNERPGEDAASYLYRLARAWFPAGQWQDPATAQGDPAWAVDPLRLGDLIQSHSLFLALVTAAAGAVVDETALRMRVAARDPEFGLLAAHDQDAILVSLLALIAHSRVPTADPTRPEPLLTIQVQLWAREVSRMMRAVTAAPAFFWRADRPLAALPRGLPAYFCRECGHSGWLAFKRDSDDFVVDDPAQIYKAYFDRSKHTCYLYPGTAPGAFAATGWRLCPRCLRVGERAECQECKGETLPVVIHRALSKPSGASRQPSDLQRCPICDTDDALSIVGSQAASLLSVAIAHLYTSPANRDKKLLAFTDSVQDAAHRAAFFGARTYRFNLRTAIQTALNAAQQDAAGVPLDRLADAVIAYWRARWRERPDGEQRLAAAFMPPDLSDLPAYRAFISSANGPLPPALASDLQRRLAWEVIMEYGFNARVGRSLEKVGSSVAWLDPAPFTAAVDDLWQVLTEEIGLLRRLPRTAAQSFLTGLLERTRRRGGVAHPFLKPYAEDQGNWYLLTKRMQPLLSPFSRDSPRFPRFLTDATRRNVFDCVFTGGSVTWVVDWAQRTLSPALGIQECNDLYRLVLTHLAATPLLHTYTQGNLHAYGLAPHALRVTAATASVRCSHCHQQETVAAAAAAAWTGQPCLNFRCAGRYKLAVLTDQAYYERLYAQGQVERIFAQEHTSLLTRERREAIEAAFKEQRQADAVNLLTATPTLEMGIDIGDLSATVACSVPPSATHYVQRIGRAGRKTGNSFIFTLANGRPHDLYFFAAPLEMLGGAVDPPGSFLNAPSMLERQFLAFCMDRWSQAAARPRDLPRNVQLLLARQGSDAFPENFLAHYGRAWAQWIELFLGQYGATLNTETQATLRAYAAGNALPTALRTAQKEKVEEREELRNLLRGLRRDLDEVARDPSQYQDPAERTRELQREIKLLQDLVKSIDEQYILSFLADAGLLPNYAFPETGVKLRTIIGGFPEAREDGHFYAVHEYVRGAAVALSELAPFNTFYAEGRKVVVDHVEIPGRDKALERWQFCDQCGHQALIQTSHYSQTCPACGSPGWSDLGQQHAMVRLRQVSAYSDHYASLLGDDADDRERERYQLRLFFAMDTTASAGAQLIPALPFGFEHFRQATVREINFGQRDGFGQKIQIADEEESQVGFRICRDCGAAAARPGDNDLRIKHTRNCTGRGGLRPAEWENVYLYRTMVSEVLRILLPVSTMLVDEKLATFAACLRLGLRRYLGGNPDHLQIAQHTEIGHDGVRRRFLVIYDTVPGGTSYLQDLAQPDQLRAVLALARDTLASCECRNDPGKAACYRCLYSYQVGSEQSKISRRLGLQLLQEILAGWDDLQPVATLADTDLISVIESELEQRLIDALLRYTAKQPGYAMQPTLYAGKEAWILTAQARQWRIEPQVLLGNAQGVAAPSRADFVFWPLGSGETARASRPVAVFTDGYAYHVRPGAPWGNVGADLTKRQALIASGRFHVWTLNWDDVEEFDQGKPTVLQSLLTTEQERSAQHLAQMLAPAAAQLPQKLWATNGVSLLLSFLGAPDHKAWAGLAKALGVATLLPPRPGVPNALIQSRIEALCTAEQAPDLTMPAQAPGGDTLYAIVQRLHLTLVVHLEQQAFAAKDFTGLGIWLRLDDCAERRQGEVFKSAWRLFCQLHNLLQFAPGFHPLTSEQVKTQTAPPAQPMAPAIDATLPSAPPAPLSPAWTSAFEFADERCRPLLTACAAANIAAPEVGYELTVAERVVAMCELAWPAAAVAVIVDDAASAVADAFEHAGWRVFALGTTATDILDAVRNPEVFPLRLCASAPLR